MIQLCPISPCQENDLANWFQLYLYEMAAETGWFPGADGRFTYPDNLLTDYFMLDHHTPYWITVDDERAGFVLVRVYPDDPSLMEIGQFFVANAHVGKGVGASAFRLALAAHPGNWQIRVLPNNQRAIRFWENNIRQIVSHEFTCETACYHSTIMRFYRFRADERLSSTHHNSLS